MRTLNQWLPLALLTLAVRATHDSECPHTETCTSGRSKVTVTVTVTLTLTFTLTL